MTCTLWSFQHPRGSMQIVKLSVDMLPVVLPHDG